MKWFKIVKELRNKLLLTQGEFGELFGVSFGTVNRWEHDTHEPTMKIKRKIKELCIEHGINLEQE